MAKLRRELELKQSMSSFLISLTKTASKLKMNSTNLEITLGDT